VQSCRRVYYLNKGQWDLPYHRTTISGALVGSYSHCILTHSKEVESHLLQNHVESAAGFVAGYYNRDNELEKVEKVGSLGGFNVINRI